MNGKWVIEAMSAIYTLFTGFILPEAEVKKAASPNELNEVHTKTPGSSMRCEKVFAGVVEFAWVEDGQDVKFWIRFRNLTLEITFLASGMIKIEFIVREQSTEPILAIIFGEQEQGVAARIDVEMLDECDRDGVPNLIFAVLDELLKLMPEMKVALEASTDHEAMMTLTKLERYTQPLPSRLVVPEHPEATRRLGILADRSISLVDEVNPGKDLLVYYSMVLMVRLRNKSSVDVGDLRADLEKQQRGKFNRDEFDLAVAIAQEVCANLRRLVAVLPPQ